MASSAFATTLCIAIGFCFRPAIVPGHVASAQKRSRVHEFHAVWLEPNALGGSSLYLCNGDVTPIIMLRGYRPATRVASCQRHTRNSTGKKHPIETPKNRPPSRTKANCKKYHAVLTSAFIHFANPNSRKAATPEPMHAIPYRSGLKFFGFPRHAAYAIAMASTGPTTKMVSSSVASVSHRYCGFMGKEYTS